jgi:hypothetical protein
MSQRHAGTEPGTISAVFPSLRAARSARERLSRAGFARNSIDIERDDDAFVVSIATRDAHPVASDLREAGSRAVEALQGNRPLALGLAALAGFALYGLTNRR